MKRLLWTGLVASVFVCGPALSFEANLVTGEQVDPVKLLPPPPSIDSYGQQRDMEFVIESERARTPGQAEKANGDNEISVFRFADVLGPRFTASELPVTSKFFQQLAALQRSILLPAKDAGWNRPRPFVTNAELHPIGELPKSKSYPSFHATFGYLAGIVLAQMVPEKAAELIARGQEYGDNRVLAGVHYPTDVEAGRRVATATATALLANPIFRAELAAAKVETRHSLGYLE